MGRGIIKIKDRYFEYSTICDAPVSYAMNKQELEEFIKEKYGQTGLEELSRRLERIEKHGVSFYGWDLEDIQESNRAGEDEACITLDEIYTRYTMGTEA